MKVESGVVRRCSIQKGFSPDVPLGRTWILIEDAPTLSSPQGCSVSPKEGPSLRGSIPEKRKDVVVFRTDTPPLSSESSFAKF